MQRNIEAGNRTALFFERLVWNAAAAAALAVMILVLLGALRWLDEVAPYAPLSGTPPVSAAGAAEAAAPAGATVIDRPSD